MKLNKTAVNLLTFVAGGLAMLGLSYAWHGIFSNDFFKLFIYYPALDETVFFTGYIAFYVFLTGLMLAFLNLVQRYNRPPFIIGLITGLIFGIGLYLAVHFSGYGWSQATGMSQMIVDLCWQGLEQLAGAFVMSYAFFRLRNMDIRDSILGRLVFIFSAPQKG